MSVRSENDRDRQQVHAINVAAFDSSAEANLIDNLRQSARPIISLVAEEENELVGHIMLSPVTLPGHPELTIMGLGPMAVAPTHQRKGYGSALVEAGLDQCRDFNVSAVVVLGHPEFYPRFGFSPSTAFGIDSEYDVPAEVFMALELEQGGLQDVTGTLRYHEAFGDL